LSNVKGTDLNTSFKKLCISITSIVLLRLILFDGMRPAIIGLAIESAASAGILPLLRASHRQPGNNANQYPRMSVAELTASGLVTTIHQQRRSIHC
jgi:hypothetical protein